MPVKRVSIMALPRSRFHTSAFTETKEWKDAIKEVKKGLGPKEAIQVRLSPESIAALPLQKPVRAFYMALKRYMKREEMPVEVAVRACEDVPEGIEIWVIGSTKQ